MKTARLIKDDSTSRNKVTTILGTIAIALVLFGLGYAIFWFIANVLFDQDPWQF